jgi:hypothetical protein
VFDREDEREQTVLERCRKELVEYKSLAQGCAGLAAGARKVA